jgi:hypothetical protein
LARAQQQRTTESIAIERQRGHLVNRGLHVRRVVAGHRPDGLFDGYRRNRDTAAAIARM